VIITKRHMKMYLRVRTDSHADSQGSDEPRLRTIRKRMVKFRCKVFQSPWSAVRWVTSRLRRAGAAAAVPHRRRRRGCRWTGPKGTWSITPHQNSLTLLTVANMNSVASALLGPYSRPSSRGSVVFLPRWFMAMVNTEFKFCRLHQQKFDHQETCASSSNIFA